MKKLRILKSVLRSTKADKVLICFLTFFFLIAAVIWAAEPDMNTYREAVWYCSAVIFTTGFGDFVPVTFLGRLCSILLSCYAVFAIAIVTGVVAAYYNQTVAVQFEDAKLAFLDKLERLPELSKEELIELSEKAKKLR